MALKVDAMNVLILGGLTHLARPLARFLLEDSELTTGAADDGGSRALVKHLRIVDRHFVSETGSTTFVDPPFLRLLRSDARLQVLQRNLDLNSVANEAFDVPAEYGGGAYDYVYDLTGDGALADAAPALLLERTTKLAGRIARIAADKRVRALVRSTLPFHSVKPDDATPSEATWYSARPPRSPRAYYWAQAERAAAYNAGDLNFVILRSAGLYGDFIYTSPIVPRLALGQLYQFTRQPLTVLWGPSLRIDSVHAHDWCTAAWKAANWIASRGKADADAEAGETLEAISKSSVRLRLPADYNRGDDVTAAAAGPTISPEYLNGINRSDGQDQNARPETRSLLCPSDLAVRAPVFHLCDDGLTNQGKMADLVRQVFPGVVTNWAGMAATAWSRLNLSSVVNDVNEDHIEAEEQMNAASEVPIVPNSPISTLVDVDLLAERAIKMSNAKAKRVLGWSPSIRLTPDVALRIVSEFREAGVWYVPRSTS